jgi:hypothetical protein
VGVRGIDRYAGNEQRLTTTSTSTPVLSRVLEHHLLVRSRGHDADADADADDDDDDDDTDDDHDDDDDEDDDSGDAASRPPDGWGAAWTMVPEAYLAHI